MGLIKSMNVLKSNYLSQATKDYLVKTLKDSPVVGDTFKIQVNKIYTDVDGTIITKASAPAGLKVDLPVYVLGNFDRNGAYRIGRRVVPAPASAIFLATFTYGFQGCPPFPGLTGFNEIAGILNPGDICTVYTDSLNAPSAFVWIVQTNSYVSIASVIENSETTLKDGKLNKLKIGSINYLVDNVDQYKSAWHITKTDNVGQYTDEQMSVIIYKLPTYKLNDFIEVKLAFTLNQYIGLNFILQYVSDSIQLDFKLLK